MQWNRTSNCESPMIRLIIGCVCSSYVYCSTNREMWVFLLISNPDFKSFPVSYDRYCSATIETSQLMRIPHDKIDYAVTLARLLSAQNVWARISLIVSDVITLCFDSCNAFFSFSFFCWICSAMMAFCAAGMAFQSAWFF